MKEALSFLAWKRILPLIATLAGFAFVFVSTLLSSGSNHGETSPYLRSPSTQLSGRFLQSDEEKCTQTCCLQFNEDVTSGSPLGAVPTSVQYIMVAVLLCLSALFSGLTLGVMGLDTTGLQIVMEGGDEESSRYARAMYPIRKNGNLILCTLLLGNTCVNAFISIILADKAGGAVGLVVSTFLIVILGEIAPQAAASRHGLLIGYRVLPIVRVVLVLFYPVAKPLAWTLDMILGHEMATVYSNTEMLKMLDIHVKENIIDQETGQRMTGALTFKDKLVRDVMTPLENTFMLSVDDKLNFETMREIFKKGYSRIPVYEINRHNVIGLLFTKDLIFLDPKDETQVVDFVDIFGRGTHTVWPDSKLGDVLRELKTGKSHMALVRDVNNEDATQDPFYEIKGIITLEDVIEEILGDEIVDETDAFVDGTHMQRVDREETFEWAKLRFLDSKIVDEKLSNEETMAVAAHLSKNYSKDVALLTERQLHRLIADTPVTTLSAPTLEFGKKLPDDLLYQAGVPTDTCTLILAGKVAVLAGSEGFRSDLSSWNLLAAHCLADSNYKPDFSAYVSSGPCRCLRISRARFAAAVDHSTAERLSPVTAVVPSNPPSVAPPSASSISTNRSHSDKLPAGEGNHKTKELARSQIIASLEKTPKGLRGVLRSSIGERVSGAAGADGSSSEVDTNLGEGGESSASITK